jgi:tRNA(adenine34) deaminase
LNHHTEVVGGVLAEACGQVLRDFFVERRAAYRQRRASTAPGAQETGENGDNEDSADPIPTGEVSELNDLEPPR